MSAPNDNAGRMRRDLTKLIERNYQVEVIDSVNSFNVMFHGPKGSLYENGVWRVHVHLPDKYPFKSPSIGFVNKIFHPNIDESSGSICLDAINQNWTALYDLVNVFDSLLPQLLLYPNAHDPLNIEAASLLLKDTGAYQRTVREHVRKFASSQATKSSSPPSTNTSAPDLAGTSYQSATNGNLLHCFSRSQSPLTDACSSKLPSVTRCNSFCVGVDCDEVSRKRKWLDAGSDAEDSDVSELSELSESDNDGNCGESSAAKHLRTQCDCSTSCLHTSMHD